VRRLVAGAVAAAMLVVPAAAEAHGGAPLSALSSGNVSIPQWTIGGQFAIDPKLHRELHHVTARSIEQGYPIKVVILVDRTDAVDVPQLYDTPDRYAQFIGSFLAQYGYQGITLAVTPNGFGLYPLHPDGDPRAVLDEIEIPPDPDVNQLATIADDAIERMLAAHAESDAGSGGGSSSVVLPATGGALALLAVAGTTAVLLRRRSRVG
jgi:hypothetical protein